MPESPGKTLKKIRETKQLSIEEVSERTRIPKRILSAIEEDRLHEIKSAFYAKTFVKSYSGFLGALEEKGIKAYLDGSEKKDAPVLVLKGERVPGEWLIKYKRYIGILVILGVCMLFFGFLQIKRLAKYVSAKASVGVKGMAGSKNKMPSPTRSPEAKKTKGFELEIIAREDTWMRVTGDRALLFSGTFKKRQRDTWRAQKEIKLELGNAGNVVLKLDGRNLGAVGKKGHKKKVIITKDGIKR